MWAHGTNPCGQYNCSSLAVSLFQQLDALFSVFAALITIDIKKHLPCDAYKVSNALATSATSYADAFS
jgi:hypothetical protein